jgi:hypothetical protein
VVERKKKKRKTKTMSFKPAPSKRGRKRKARHHGRSLKAISIAALTAAAVLCLFVTAGIGFAFLDKYVKNNVLTSETIGCLELVGVPHWLNEPLKEKIYAAAAANGEDFRLDDDVAVSVRNNLADNVPWLDHVTVQATPETIRIKAFWRKPLALLPSGRDKFYVDAESVVLDYVPMPNLPIVEIKGLTTSAEVPTMGQPWQRDDLAAAVTILDRLDRMDKLVTPDNPLLYEIDSIDVSNFNGRRSPGAPHIVLYVKDCTEIVWGVEYGAWQRHLDVPDEEKLARLYSYYKEYGSLQGGAKFINLCEPDQTIPLPIDRY